MGPEEREKYISRDLRIHRKYILVLSVVILVIVFGDIKFNRVNFVGFIADIENPQVLIITTLLLLAFSIFRYYQYFDNDCIGYIKTNYKALFDLKLNKFVGKKIKQKYAPEFAQLQTLGKNQFKLKENGDWIINDAKVKKSGWYSDGSSIIDDVPFTLSRKSYRLLSLKCYWSYLWRRPYFFELLFPFIIGGVSLFIGLYHTLIDVNCL